MAAARRLWGIHQRLLGSTIALVFIAHPAAAAPDGDATFCVAHQEFCADSIIPYEGHYVGHDEPSILFYSDAPASGNNVIYTLRLPKEPPSAGLGIRGTTLNVQLYETFWFGMAMCDTQSAPEATNTCVPDSDANVFDNPDPAAPDYIGKHPGTAYMELQFYPPWSPFGVDRAHWYAALNIFSVSFDQNNGIPNNQDCLDRVGIETVNSALITRNGVADLPAGPLSRASADPNPRAYFPMNPGDLITVLMHDTPDGFQAVIYDLTTHRHGSMTASVANGFSQVIFDPNASTCATAPYSFHPMYDTSSEHTRVPWTVHSYNVALAFEIGHSEADDHDGDDAKDSDFDGVSYRRRWPGTARTRFADWLLHPRPLRFTSPISSSSGGILQNYQRVAFEADLPPIEAGCNALTGAGCSNPPANARFYPIFTTRAAALAGCVWQFGGANMPGTINTFGGSPTAEYGDLLPLIYPAWQVPIFSDFRQVLDLNPCAIDSRALPHLSVPQVLRFPAKTIGSTSASREVEIVNRSRIPVEIAGIAASGDFAVQTSDCAETLRPRSRCTVWVTFSPRIPGLDVGSLTISDNAINAPQTVTLTGVGE